MLILTQLDELDDDTKEIIMDDLHDYYELSTPSKASKPVPRKGQRETFLAQDIGRNSLNRNEDYSSRNSSNMQQDKIRLQNIVDSLNIRIKTLVNAEDATKRAIRDIELKKLSIISHKIEKLETRAKVSSQRQRLLELK
jgi:hypothetical protein